MPDNTTYEDNTIGIAILDIPLGWWEKILSSKRLTNIAIAILITMTALMFFGIAVFATNLFAPAEAAQISLDHPRAPNR